MQIFSMMGACCDLRDANDRIVVILIARRSAMLADPTPIRRADPHRHATRTRSPRAATAVCTLQTHYCCDRRTATSTDHCTTSSNHSARA